MDNKASKNHEKIQTLASEVDEIQERFGGRDPKYINMYFAAKLRGLTRVLIWVTVVLAILAVIQIILLIMTF